MNQDFLIQKKAPRCCGQSMFVSKSIGKFVEMYCGICEDVVYIKHSVAMLSSAVRN